MMMKTTMMNHFQRVRQPHHHHHCEVAHPPPSCRVVSRDHDVPPPHSPLPEFIFQDTTDSMAQDTATVLLPQFDRHVSPLGGCIGCRVVSRHVRGRITHTRLINGCRVLPSSTDIEISEPTHPPQEAAAPSSGQVDREPASAPMLNDEVPAVGASRTRVDMPRKSSAEVGLTHTIFTRGIRT
jgi:hypothetical protein